MSFANPTPLQVGMTGKLADKSYRVAGRVVMGMDDGGETYYWSEFNLVSDDGDSATLVYEETERGGQWRLFIMFEAEYPMTAADAATKRVGDSLNLEGTQVRVTLVDESRVYHIEGEAPEGVEIGDVARYFNAEAGNNMVVVSWTGDEVEYYRGVDLPRGTVASAFNLPHEVPVSSLNVSDSDSSWADSTGEHYDTMGQFALKAVGVVLVLAAIFAGYSFWKSKHQGRVVKTSAPAAQLTLGSSGRLDDKNYNIEGHQIVEIAQVGLLYDRHEYQLLDSGGNESLLVYGLKPKAKEWFLFTPLHPLNVMTPNQAAALRAGDPVNLSGYVAPVAELFRCVVNKAEGTNLFGLQNGTMLFGFSAQSGSIPLLVRWNNTGISFYAGKSLPAKDVTVAFSR